MKSILSLHSFPSLVCGMTLLCILFLTNPVKGEREREYKVKAAFLYNFAQFVTWPSNQSTKEERQFNLCLYGNSPIHRFLEESVQGKKLHNKEVFFLHLTSRKAIQTCHLLFIGTTRREWTAALRPTLRGKPILTIAEFDQFSKTGGMIQFFIEDKKVRFAINPDEVERGNLHISSKLLQLAKIVNEKDS